MSVLIRNCLRGVAVFGLAAPVLDAQPLECVNHPSGPRLRTPDDRVPASAVAQLPRCRLARVGEAEGRRTVRVERGTDLQRAIDAARPGDVLELEAGATYRGSFVLPAKAGSGWITIRGSGAGRLPSGRRVRPADSTAMARLVSAHWSEPAIRTAAGAARWRLVGLNIAVEEDRTSGYTLVALGSAQPGEQLTRESIPTDIVLERVFVHGHPDASFQRCIGLNSGRTIIVDSHISECHGKGMDAQAIGGWNGPGPYLIRNNYLEASTQVIMFGGADPSIRDLSPSDIEISANHMFTPRAWVGRYPIKGQLEFKHAVRVLIEGNVFDYDGGNSAYSQLWKSTNQSGTAPWSVTKDVTFRLNIVRNALGAFNLAAQPEPFPVVPAHRFTIEHNVIENMSGRNFQASGIDDLVVSNNSFLGGGTHGVLLYGSTMKRFVFLRNVLPPVDFPFGSADGKGYGDEAIEGHTTGWRLVDANAFMATDARLIPRGSTTPPRGAPLGRVGADRAAVDSATRGVVQR